LSFFSSPSATLPESIAELSKHYDPAKVEAAFSSSTSRLGSITTQLEEAGDGARGIVRGYGISHKLSKLKFCQDGFFAASPGIKIPAQYMEALRG